MSTGLLDRPARPERLEDAATTAGRRPARVPAGLVRHLPLLAVLSVQATLSLSLDNTAFTDEALYLYAGRLELEHLLHGAPMYQDFATYFSGSPWIYPPIGAAFSALGGLAAARAFSLVLMLAATALVYGSGRRLVGERAGALGALAFSVAGPTLFLGHFATYDPMAVCLLALAAWCAARARNGRARAALVWSAAAGGTTALAGMTKYAAFAYLPVVGALVLLAHPEGRGPGRLLARAVAVLAGFGALLAGLVGALGHSFWEGLSTTTMSRPQASSSFGQVLSTTVHDLAPLLVLALAGAALERRRGRRLLLVVLAAAALIAPAWQAHLHTTVSLDKHLDYGAVFAAPAAGLALARLLEWSREHLSVAVANLALLVCLVVLGLSPARAAFSNWVNATPLVSLVESQLRPVTGRYLVENSQIPEYYLEALSKPYQWTSTYYFAYTDPASHRLLTGLPAYEDALAHRYFDLVVLTYGPTYDLDLRLASVLARSPDYQLIVKAPYGNGGRLLMAWRLR